MTDKTFHFVRHHEVAAFERVGWQRHDSLDGTHHGQWSALMEWKGTGEPVKPFHVNPPRETADVEQRNSAAVRMNVERDAWADTDADDLARAVADLSDEMAGVSG